MNMVTGHMSLTLTCERINQVGIWKKVIVLHLEIKLSICTNPLSKLMLTYSRIAKFMGPIWGTDGPHVGPMNLAIRVVISTQLW